MCKKCDIKPKNTIEFVTFIADSSNDGTILIGVKSPIKLTINSVEKRYLGGDLVMIPADIYTKMLDVNFPIWKV